MIVVSQLCGAIFGVLMVASCAVYTMEGKASAYAVLAPSEPFHAARVIIPELFASFIFVSFVLSVKYH